MFDYIIPYPHIFEILKLFSLLWHSGNREVKRRLWNQVSNINYMAHVNCSKYIAVLVKIPWELEE